MMKAALIAAALTCGLPILARADTIVPLSSLDVTKGIQGYLTPKANNLSVDGHPLTLAGKTFASGFGTHSQGALSILLDGRTTRFQAVVGIDDEVPVGRGSAEFEVFGDGKTLYRSGVRRRGQPPATVDVDLTGVHKLLLRVTDGDDGYEFDHSDWADARFTVLGKMPETRALPVSEPKISEAAAPAAPQIQNPSIVGVRTGAPFLWTIPVSGVRPLAVTARDLPPGLTIDAATGTITGNASRVGDFRVPVRVRNRAGVAERAIHIVVGSTLALTPPMGWNSYDAYGDSVTEAETLANAEYMRAKMQSCGWNTIVIDYRWSDPKAHDNNAHGSVGAVLAMDGYGRLMPAPRRFPSANDGNGFRALADKIHAMGLQFGIHIMRGIPRSAVAANLPIEGSPFHAADAANTKDTCPWCADMYGVRGDTPAGRAYYDSIFRLYAAWGVDFVKMDDTSSPYHTDEIDAAHDAIAKCGRAIVYSLSPGETPVAQSAHVADHANMWRVSGDFWDHWSQLRHEFAFATRWQGVPGPGHWPDADMLPVGHLSVGSRSVDKDRRTGFTRAEQVTLLSFWSLLPAPLMVGAALPDNDPWTLALLTNPEVLAVDQDAGGTTAARVAGGDGTEVWSRTLADGTRAVGLFNRNEWDTDITVRSADLGVGGKWTVRDLWQRTDRGPFGDAFTATVPAHGTTLLLLRPAK